MTAAAPPLPPLRPELKLIKGAASVTGAPTWLIHDPLQNRFVQIDDATHRVLSLWPWCGTPEDLIAMAASDARVALDGDSVARLIDFLHRNKLTSEPPRDGWRYFARERSKGEHAMLARLIHNYLFFRIPLCRPQAFLERTLPLARRLGSRRAQKVMAVLGLAGLYLVSRQWDEFAATFEGFFSWEGALLMAAALAFVKAAHELGHAYTAVRFGCRVPTMGVAFMLMAPLLYTDVTDAWRLRDRRQRLMIDSAGIRVELAIAAVAMFAWAFLPEGPGRSVAFILASVSVVSSLAINLNPFMRFDGYYLLTEILGVENLQPRAFDLGCWKMRELLFGLGVPCPEQLPRRLVWSLVVYAWAVWIYRLVLFTGIALLVYHYFFKALGIVLFAIEIAVFVLRPAWSELRVWYGLRRQIAASRRSVAAAAMTGCALLLSILPWSTQVEIPGVLEFAEMAHVHAVHPGRIEAVHVTHGETVRAGQPLITLVSPDVDQDLVLQKTKLRLARMQHARRGADAADREASLILENTIAALVEKIGGLERQREELVVKAPITGRIVEFNPALHAGRWIGPRERIGIVAGGEGRVVRGYVSEANLWRIAPGDKGRFIPEALQRASTGVSVAEISIGSTDTIEILDLASIHSGRIAVNAGEQHRLVPAVAQYQTTLRVTGSTGADDLAVRGVVEVVGRPESLLARVWRQTLKVLLREAGA